MKITRTSMLSGIAKTKEIACTEKELAAYEAGGILLQNAFPTLSAGDREFIKTGIDNEEWEETFGKR